MLKGTSKLLIIFLISAFTISCRDIVFTDSAAIPGRSWDLANIQVFRIPVKDTVNSNDISFTIRTGSSYPFRNIYLFVTTTSPAGNSMTDTLQYYLSDEKGKWLGKGFGDIHELTLPYKKNVYFPVPGTYQIQVQHGMRMKELKGVYDLGIKVTRTAK